MQPIAVKVTRNGMNWHAELPGGFDTWARTLPGLDQAVRDTLALASDLSDEEAEKLPLRYDYLLGAVDSDSRRGHPQNSRSTTAPARRAERR